MILVVYDKCCIIDGNNCLVKIIDTVGQEEHKPLEESYMRNAEGFLLVFSINDKSSFERIQSFHEQILGVKDADKGSVPMILVGNKSDMDSKRTVTTNEAVEYSKKINIQYLESSAKERINVDEAFLILVKQIKKNRAPVQVPVPEKSEKAQKKDCIIA